MKCFIHMSKEAIAACRTCGKGMCSNCSAYSGHTGTCPACRKNEFEQEVTRLQREKVEYIWKAIGSGLISFLIIPIFFLVKNILCVKKTSERIVYLCGEIEKLNKALKSGSAMI